jgi:hypothetical protein
MGKETGNRVVVGLFEVDRVITFENPKGTNIMPNSDAQADPLFELDSNDDITPKKDT